MRAFVCIDGREWDEVLRGAARYLREGEAIVAHAVDERVPRGYDLAVRGLLGRRRPCSAGEMAAASRAAAEELLAEAKVLLEGLSPALLVETLLLSGQPNEELIRAAGARAARIIFVGRGTPGARSAETISGTVRGWKRNHGGEWDGIYLGEGIEVGFPPHRAPEIRGAVREGDEVEVVGTRHGRRLHAHRIIASGTSLEAHKPPHEEPGPRLGCTARFIADHAPCDVMILRP